MGTLKPLTFLEIRQGVCFAGRILAKKLKFWTFGATYPPHAAIEVKFRIAKRTLLPLGRTTVT